MKLSKVEPYVVCVPKGDRGNAFFFLIRLLTDDGMYGWGETALGGSLNDIRRVYPVLVEESFNAFVKGNSPFDRELVSGVLYRRMMNSRPDLILMGIISAFDTAMWDICGKVLGKPVYDLLGGKCRDRLRSYSYIYTPDNAGDPESVAAEALRMKERGFTAVKYDPVPVTNDNDSGSSIRPFQLSLAGLKRADAIMAAIRKAVGDEVDIMIGTHGQITTSSAIRLAKVLEPYQPLWFEEPVPPENRDEMAVVSRSTTIPVSTGERLAGIHEFREVLERKTARILQPDIGSCGGISAGRKIAAMAEAYYAEMAYHIWGGPVITAAALQLDAVIPNFLIQESIYDSSSGLFGSIQTQKLLWKDGYFMTPDLPGIGVDFDMTMIHRMSAT
ncbi:MAG: mandelate racemase/muconate lactonizing enzyme family protein [Treponema sp.]|jgi:2-dehydro-3-deoxyphosphogalactonate aldolase|nr:mandelate racemase/muconate lactonizing enzyme family protein [Treponema sp.]